MYDYVAKNKRVAQVILALIALPFAFFGVDYYFQGGVQEGDVAKVDGESVSRFEFDQALREQQDRLRQALGKNFDPAMLDSPEARARILDDLVARKLLQQRAREQAFQVSNRQLEQFVRGIPAFHDNGEFSFDRYQEALRAQGMTQAMFEARVRQDLALQPLDDPFSAGSIVSRQYVRHVLELAEEQREVRAVEISPQPYLAQVKVDDAQAKAFYDGNQGGFQVPEQARVEYLILSLDSLASQIAVDPAEVRQQYEQNVKQYAQAEERKASHILITASRDAKPEERAAAKKKAEDIAAQARQAPDRFAALARQHSQDPGSRDEGGDLGYFARGSMVKPFEDAVFGMKPGEIAGPVETDFGYHVIRLDGLKGEGPRPFEELKAQIEQDVRRQKAARKFAELAEQFQNLVYEQADSLAGVEKALHDKGAAVKVERTDWIGREQVQALALNNQRFVQALFAADSVQGKRNTEAIEIAPNTLIAGRVVEHKPAAPRPFEEVKSEILRQLQAKAAGELASKDGRDKLALLQQGKPAGVDFGPARTISRAQRLPGIADDAMKQIFAASADKLPAFVGAATEQGGYALVKVEKSIAAKPDPQRVDAMLARVSEQIGREQFSAYVAALRQKGDVRINQANLERK